MATLRQIRTVENLLANPGSVKQAMKDAGYSDVSASNPQELTRTKTFQELAIKYGLTDKLITGSLVADIRAKPGNRVQELALAAKIRGYTADKQLPTGNITQINVINYSK